jgi:uncharacterized protein YjbI with pentapeptide repeats
MSSEVTAAVIAAGVSFLTLIGTLAAQYFGRRATKQDTEEAFKEQREQLDKTLTEQGKQLDKTLAEQRTRTLNERFATAAAQLGSDKPPEVRLAGVYAMAGLADDWKEDLQNRQTCVDVLCAYLRMPYGAEPEPEASEEERLAFRASREVRHTVIRVITAHLQEGATVSWQGLNFDFTGVVFDGGDFSGARFSGGTVTFRESRFSGGYVGFDGAEFSGSTVSFERAEFSGSKVVSFVRARFSRGAVSFFGAEFSASTVTFGAAVFSGGSVTFQGAVFSAGPVTFASAVFSDSTVTFAHAVFSGGSVSFQSAEFSGGTVDFFGAAFSAGEVYFGDAVFSGSTVTFDSARFFGGVVDFSNPGDRSFPPAFPWTDTPPPGVKPFPLTDTSRADAPPRREVPD